MCFMRDGKAVYSYDGGPDGYTSDIPADISTGDTFRLRPRPSEHVSQSSTGFLGDDWAWYWVQAPDEDWFAIQGVSEDYQYTINVETTDDLPVRHQATRLRTLGIYDSNGTAVPGTSGSGSGKKRHLPDRHHRDVLCFGRVRPLWSKGRSSFAGHRPGLSFRS